jgi:hypothetical protein
MESKIDIQDVIELRWCPARRIQIAYSISGAYLKQLEAKGYIRSTKIGAVQQAKKLYCCEDIDTYFKAKSAGRKPKIMRGKVA